MNEYITRLMDIGLSPVTAAEVCVCYLSRKDTDGLEAFISNIEKRKDSINERRTKTYVDRFSV